MASGPGEVSYAPNERPGVDAADTARPDTVPESPAETVGPQTAQAPGLLIDDDSAEIGPTQLRKTDFLEQLQAAVCAEAEAALAGTGNSTEGCPYLQFWFTYYRGQDSGYIERALWRYAPEARTARSAGEYVPLVAARVRQGVERWARTGEISGVPEDAPRPPGAPVAEAEAATSSVQLKEKGVGRPSDDPAAVRARLGKGRRMEGGVRQRMERAFGRSFSGVQLHTDATAVKVASEQRARALAVGEHVAFGAGEYRPGTMVGDALIAHELAHTIQQHGGSSKPQGRSVSSSGYEALEQDADQAAAGAVAALWRGPKGALTTTLARATPSMRSGLRLQRCKSEPSEPITSRTVVTTPAPRTRDKIGVGEEVDLTHTAGSATWSTTAGTLSATTGATVRLTAPDTAQKITVQANTATKDFTVLAPTIVAMDRQPGTGVKHQKDRPDSGIQTRVYLGPDTVNFNRARYRELDVAAVVTNPGAYSCFAGFPHCGVGVGSACPDKALTTTVVAGMGTLSVLGDCAYSGDCATPAPFTPGSITYTIPYEYKVGAGAFHSITNVTQVHTLDADGSTLRSSKAGANGDTTVPAASVVLPQCP